jgi:lactoylglutathione lyase
MAIQCLAHIGICVSEIERSRRFYRDLLGFKEVARLQVVGQPSATLLDLPELDLRAWFLERDGVRIELLTYARPGAEREPGVRPMNRCGLTHLAIRIDDFEATLAALRAAGVAVMEHTRIHNPQFDADVAYVLDPDGTRIELIAAPGDPRAPLGEPLR